LPCVHLPHHHVKPFAPTPKRGLSPPSTRGTIDTLESPSASLSRSSFPPTRPQAWRLPADEISSPRPPPTVCRHYLSPRPPPPLTHPSSTRGPPALPARSSWAARCYPRAIRACAIYPSVRRAVPSPHPLPASHSPASTSTACASAAIKGRDVAFSRVCHALFISDQTTRVSGTESTERTF